MIDDEERLRKMPSSLPACPHQHHRITDRVDGECKKVNALLIHPRHRESGQPTPAVSNNEYFRKPLQQTYPPLPRAGTANIGNSPTHIMNMSDDGKTFEFAMAYSLARMPSFFCTCCCKPPPPSLSTTMLRPEDNPLVLHHLAHTTNCAGIGIVDRPLAGTGRASAAMDTKPHTPTPADYRPQQICHPRLQHDNSSYNSHSQNHENLSISLLSECGIRWCATGWNLFRTCFFFLVKW